MGSRRVCSVCCHAVAQYICPRCHRSYCSSACYKEHSHQCTEAFYREQATSQLKATRADEAQTRKMLQILQRMHQHDMDNDDESDSNCTSGSDDEGMSEQLPSALRHLIEQAALEGEQFDVHPKQLTEDVVAELEQLSLKGQLSHLVPVWQPWWTAAAAGDLQLSASGQHVVQELQTTASSGRAAAAAADLQNSNGKDCRSNSTAALAQQPGTAVEQQQQQQQQQPVQEQPQLPSPPSEPLPSLSSLAGPRVQPSPLLPWQLLQLLVAYAAVERLYNGEPEATGWEAAEQLLLLSPPLMQQRVQAAAAQEARNDEAAQLSTSTTDDSKQQKQQWQQLHTSAVHLAPPDCVRVANMQLAAAAAQMCSTNTASCSRQHEGSQPWVAAGAVPSELRLLLQVGLSDALQLLQLGRSAVVLALADAGRLLEQGMQEVKQQQQLQQHHEEQQPGKLRSAGTVAALQSAGPLQPLGKQHPKNHKSLCRQLFLAGRKVHFFTVWSNEQPPDVFERLVLELQLELHEQESMQADKSKPLLTKTGFPQPPLNVKGTTPSFQLQRQQGQQQQLRAQQQNSSQQQQQQYGHSRPNSAASNTVSEELEARCTAPIAFSGAAMSDDDLYSLD